MRIILISKTFVQGRTKINVYKYQTTDDNSRKHVRILSTQATFQTSTLYVRLSSMQFITMVTRRSSERCTLG